MSFFGNLRGMRLFCLFLLLPTLAMAEHPMLRSSGLPIPRFVSLKFDEVNMRIGPGRDYGVKWVFKRRYYPVEVIEEFGHWRKIRDRDNTQGWVYHSQLSGSRYAFVRASDTYEMIPLYASADATSRIVMEAQAGAMLHIAQCNGQWCQAQINERSGWLEQAALWGTYPQEAFE